MDSTNVVTLQSCLDPLEDPRVVERCKHSLLNVVTMAICAMICGANDWENIALYARTKRNFFKQFLDLSNGTPSADTFSRVFSVLDPAQLETCYRTWLQQVVDLNAITHIAIDGKTIRRSHDKKGNKPPLHIVSAFASENGLVLSQVKTEEKSNEITAIPDLLDKLVLDSSVVTVDAMGCQHKIVEKIVDQNADYTIAIKGNQPKLEQQITACFSELMSCNFNDPGVDFFEQIEKNRGRMEIRRLWCTEDLTAIPEAQLWENARSVVLIESVRRVDEEETVEHRYYLSSCPADAKGHAEVIRKHWGIENSVHWVLDVTFREDESRVRNRVSAENLSLLRKIALNTVKQDKTKKCSQRSKRNIAGWDDKYLAVLIKSLLV